ncbi:hypothetical protein [Methylophilus sp. UBA6697]|jgi:glucose dehydrogenase|uniref:hypothetical protein n=1 Tax=Methylophilus sp. UBA6697 TaxID=1946902 RepID=UPI000ECD187F|nr:hypothetical protein [Methylophilus sp. UBA6697]HCU83865.1 hypothetical protein [Methylophilus sp.]
MHLSFHSLALFTAALFLLLAIIWMLAPTRLLAAWGVGFSNTAGLVSRRAAALYAGIALMFFLARNAAPSATSDALVYGLIATCMILALLGIYEFAKGRANKGILTAVLIEVALCLLFLLPMSLSDLV